jgi:hypothetical protein
MAPDHDLLVSLFHYVSYVLFVLSPNTLVKE